MNRNCRFQVGIILLNTGTGMQLSLYLKILVNFFVGVQNEDVQHCIGEEELPELNWLLCMNGLLQYKDQIKK